MKFSWAQRRAPSLSCRAELSRTTLSCHLSPPGAVDGGMVGLSAGVGSEPGRQLVNKPRNSSPPPLPLPSMCKFLVPREGPSAGSPLGHFFTKFSLFPSAEEQATRDHKEPGAPILSSVGLFPFALHGLRHPSVIESPEPDLNPKLCVSVVPGLPGHQSWLPCAKILPRAATSRGPRPEA